MNTKYNFKLINECDETHLKKIKENIKNNGYDCSYPIFYSSEHGALLTGSHRYKACFELQVKPRLIDLGQEVAAYLYANNMNFDEIDFEEINDYSEYEMLKYFSRYEDDYNYGECCECETYAEIGLDTGLCVECNYFT